MSVESIRPRWYGSANLRLRPEIDLQAERLNRGLSQEAIADEIGVSRRIWQRAESGLGVSPRNAFTIASYFDAKVTELWEPDPDPDPIAA